MSFGSNPRNSMEIFANDMFNTHGISFRVSIALLNEGVRDIKDVEGWVKNNAHRLHEVQNLGKVGVNSILSAFGLTDPKGGPKTKLGQIKDKVDGWRSGTASAEATLDAISAILKP